MVARAPSRGVGECYKVQPGAVQLAVVYVLILTVITLSSLLAYLLNFG